MNILVNWMSPMQNCSLLSEVEWPKYKSNGWKCKSCKVLDTQEHVELCPVFESLRKEKDLTVKKNLVDYYRRVIQIRQSTDV